MKLCNEIDVGSIEGKQLDLCKGNMIYCHVDCFFKGKKDVATTTAMNLNQFLVQGDLFCVSGASFL